MSQLGYESFHAIGHDRGARVIHRMLLDHGQRIKKAAVLDMVPTYEMYKTTDKEFATAFYHWFFLIQPAELPERLITAQSEYFLRSTLKSLSGDISAFTPEAVAQYVRCLSDPATVHGICEDYRASASIDLQHSDDTSLACSVTLSISFYNIYSAATISSQVSPNQQRGAWWFLAQFFRIRL